MLILGIETSCDDTSIAILEGRRLIGMVKYTQEIHEKYGGVVPEVSARLHLEKIILVCNEVITQSGINIKDIDAIGVTRGPGLIGSLVVGSSFAKGLSIALGKPVFGVNHLIGHIHSAFIIDEKQNYDISFPFLACVFSGGHSIIALVKDYFDIHVIATTLDDSAGEALDKGGRLLGLGFPAGPLIDKISKNGNENAFHFPIPSCQFPHFSFSGIKTALLYFLKEKEKEDPSFISRNLADLCASYQYSIISHLVNRIMDILHILKSEVKGVVISGGVAANSLLKKKISEISQNIKIPFYIVSLRYATDNGAMAAISAYFAIKKNISANINFTTEAKLYFPFYNLNKLKIH